MKKIIALAFCALCCVSAFGWGARGHSTITCIADNHLTAHTRKACEQYLGRSISFFASWPDQWREDPSYAFSNKAHTFPIGADFKYAPVDGNIDAIKLLDEAIAVVKDRRNQTDSAVAVNLKFIIHMVGDMHCPSHSKYTTINVGFKVYPYKGEKEKVSYHNVWDDQIVSRYCQCFSPAELAEDLDRLSRKEVKALQEGWLIDWANESAELNRCIYDMAGPGDTVYKPFYNAAWPIVQDRMTRAGIRLAKVLNDCFSK